MSDRKEYDMKYRHSKKGKAAQKKYSQSEKGKKKQHEYYIKNKNKFSLNFKKYQQSKKGKESHNKSTIKWKKNNPDYYKKYPQTERGKMVTARIQARRKRNLDWTKLFPNPFDISVEIDWHHISDEYVVAIPKELHQLYNGYKNHRELCMNIVSQLYEVMP